MWPVFTNFSISLNLREPNSSPLSKEKPLITRTSSLQGDNFFKMMTACVDRPYHLTYPKKISGITHLCPTSTQRTYPDRTVFESP